MYIRLADQTVGLEYPETLGSMMAAIFPDASGISESDAVHSLLISGAPERYSIDSHCAEPIDEVPDGDLPRVVLEEVGRSLVYDLKSAVAVHAGAVALGNDAILVVGPTGAGKSSLVAWLASHGFAYLTDELVAVHPDLKVEPHRRPLIVKPSGIEAVAGLAHSQQSTMLRSGPNRLLVGPQADAGQDRYRCGLVVFVAFLPGSEAAIEVLTPAQTTMRLMASNLNARNLDGHGLGLVGNLARMTPAVTLRYGDFDQLSGVLDQFILWSLQSRLGPVEARRLTAAFNPPRHDRAETTLPKPVAPKPATFPIPEATSKRFPGRLTIGMATYDDFDGAYFSLQALRLYHREVVDEIEFVIIDNHPTGPAAKPLKDLEKWVPNYRYVPRIEMSGTAIRNAVFEEASGAWVLCIDSHVFIEPGAVAKLLAYAADHPDSGDLLQGPLIYDNLTGISTHFEPKWRRGMYGHWGTDPRGADQSMPPFEIPMQGLGLFACRRDAWLPFNPAFHGFGGEEGYIHEKFRQAGRRTLCLPFLRWLHRFQRPLGAPYRNKWEDRIRNYWIGLTELGLSTDEMEAHFSELLGTNTAANIFDNIREEFGQTAP